MRYMARCPGANASSCRAWATRDPAAMVSRTALPRHCEPSSPTPDDAAFRSTRRPRSARLARIRRSQRRQARGHQVTFFRRVRAMLGVSGDHDELAGTQGDIVGSSQLNGDVPGEDQERLVDLMLVPDELAARLHE